MLYIFILTSIILLIITFLYYMNIFLSKKKKNLREKSSPIECGFNMLMMKKLPFSLQFYYICILFLIFDTEISLIIPIIQKLNYYMLNNWMLTIFMIIIILIIGLYLEWWNNLIKWN